MICGGLATQPYVPPSSRKQEWYPARTSLEGRSYFVVKGGKALWPLLALQHENGENLA